MEQYLGKQFQPFKPMPKWEWEDYLGWGEQGDGKLYYGLYVQVSARPGRQPGGALSLCFTCMSRIL